MNDIGDHVVYALAWLIYGALHSLLARQAVYQRLTQQTQRKYRVIYNAIAVLHLGATLLVGYQLLNGSEAAFWAPGFLGPILLCVQIAGAILIVMALRQYDLGLFSGLKQWRGDGGENNLVDGQEALTVSGLSAHMRHPLYTGVMLVLWGGAVSEFAFATALWATIYIFIGAYFEERKLIVLYGDAYRAYQEQIPAFIPWKSVFAGRRTAD
ncbi:MAG: NnrU family protein [Pseudomonadota bacterium]